MLNFLSRTLTLTLTLKQHSFKNQTNPNPVNMFYWHPFEFVHFFMHTHPTPLPIPTLPCFWAFCSLMHLKMFIIFCFIYHDVSCNKYLPFQLCFSWKVLSTLRGDIPFFLCTFLPLSEWFSEKWGQCVIWTLRTFLPKLKPCIKC